MTAHQGPLGTAEEVRVRLEAAESCARLLRDHLTGDGGFGGRVSRLNCGGCREAVQAWEDAARNDGDRMPLRRRRP